MTKRAAVKHRVCQYASDASRILANILAGILLLFLSSSTGHAASELLQRYLSEVPANALLKGAEAYGEQRSDVPVAPILKGGQTVGYAFMTSDFVGTTGYSGKPIHVLVAIGQDAVLQGVKLVKHSEPIVLVGIPEKKVADLTASYAGLDLRKEAQAGGSAHDLNIISGATVTIMVIDDSVVRSGLRVSRAMGLGGLSMPTAPTGPVVTLNPEAKAPQDWLTLTGDGTLRRLSLDVGQINQAFAAMPDPRARERAIEAEPSTTFIDLYTGLVSVPAIGAALLGPREHANLESWLKPGEHAIVVAAHGLYSFKGSGYVRGGLFDRIQLIQNDMAVRFRDKDHRRLGQLAPADTPQGLREIDLFRIPAGSAFDPAKPWRLQLLVHREVGPIDKLYTTFDLNYALPNNYLRTTAPPPASVAQSRSTQISDRETERSAKAALWQRIWRDRSLEIGIIALSLLVLSGAFFFQMHLTKSAERTFWFRMGFLTFTLFFIGWYANAQLSVVNLMALFSSLQTGFTWETFLLDPLVFLLWFSVAAALILWGRGAYCGWLCPFGALQELSNRIARYFGLKQLSVPWAVHERLSAFKYLIFLGLAGVALASIDEAEKLAEVEPFKTAIILKFDRAWPFVLYALAILGVGLFIERFYCRYLCPLGAALAIPARMRIFDWLKRYRECGNPCKVCATDCPVQAINPIGEISPNECVNCMNCQVLYQSKTRCPAVIKKLKRQGVLPRDAEPLDPIAAGVARKDQTVKVSI
ncbi:MAG: NosR/NirI family protein [Alphaproteobacteria bacterium]|nr:NosR/NirI family protein [Alphaproteobacteria bacterium]